VAAAREAARQPAAVALELHERQSFVFESPATEILFGGAAGGGKSFLLRAALIAWAVAIPGLQAYLFRRTYPELVSSHLDGPGSFYELLAPWLESGHARINRSDLDILFPASGSAIHLRHCQFEADVYRYQGAEIHVLAIDEATHFSSAQYRFLRSRVRLGGLEVPAGLRARFPRILAASNPGGLGHNWVRSTWIDPHPPLEIWRAPAEEGGMLRQYVPARLADNPTLVRNDPTYAHRLAGLGSPELVRAMLEGDWDIVAGGALDDVWTPERQILKPFPIPEGWRIDRSFDWGSSRPFAVCWWAESNGESIPQPGGGDFALPAGSLVQIAELYGWNGKPNEGCRKVATEIAREILAAETAMGLSGRVEPGPADSAIFAVENGQSIADDMARAGVRWVAGEKGPGSRRTGLERVRRMLKAAAASPREEPGLFFFDTCRHSLRTLPALPRDDRKPDDVDTEAEDHVYDALRYRAMAPRASASWAARPW